MSDLTVACVLRSGGAYRPGHVHGLRAQVAHWLPSARFVCLSDMQVDCERVPLESDWPGWWAKIELFEHFRERTFYLDLDSVIVGNPAPLAVRAPGAFRMIRNWVYPELFASGVMAWDGDYSHITRDFEADSERVMAEYVTRDKWGDQAFIAETAGKVQPFEKGQVLSYKYQRLQYRTTVPKHASVVAFNGDCLPWHGPDWARKWWAACPIAA